MSDMIVALAILAVLGGAARYVYKAKKRGQKCIGCPHCDACSSKSGGCSCG